MNDKLIQKLQIAPIFITSEVGFFLGILLSNVLHLQSVEEQTRIGDFILNDGYVNLIHIIFRTQKPPSGLKQ